MLGSRLVKQACHCILPSLFCLIACGSRGNAAEAESKDFRPIEEAKQPAGFPEYTPVGEIRVKHYPAHRKATASGLGAFWSLFGHIKSNQVAMTAPVEMTYGDPRAPGGREKSMSFFYESPDQGKSGKQGAVEVADVPAATVVSIGCRGPRSREAVDQARARLLQWLDENREKYSAAGPLRIMGYNSPFIPVEKQFFEVQIPINQTPNQVGCPTKGE